MVSLITVLYRDVAAATERAKDSMCDVQEYNTHFHEFSAISAILPNLQDQPPTSQPWLLLSPWLGLLRSSRNLKDSDIHRILPGGFLALLGEVSEVALIKTRLPADDDDDLAAYFRKRTLTGQDIEDVVREARLFVRMDPCSLKDAMSGGDGPVKDVRELYTRLATSARGMAGVNDLRRAGLPVVMYLFPWDESMRTDLEYRVFCPPPLRYDGPREEKRVNDKGIAAISQYRWHEPWFHRDKSSAEQAAIAERLVQHCQELFDEIVTHPAMTPAIRERGFSFDVVEDPETQRVRLIELNDFGAQSGCGSCLYHWIKDARLLYRREDSINVRVSF
ncbi:MAG: hypothetical protein Q9201_000452 [Fulgogasparrea decipioides]